MLSALLSQASAVVAAWIVAIAAVAAAAIYWLTFKSVNEQTKISRAQLGEKYDPRLKVEVLAYIPAEGEMRETIGKLKLALTNLGGATLQELTATARSRGGEEYTLLPTGGSLSVFPGPPHELVGPFYIPSIASNWSIEMICIFETGDGKKWKKWDSWQLDLVDGRIHERRLLDSRLTPL